MYDDTFYCAKSQVKKAAEDNLTNVFQIYQINSAINNINASNNQSEESQLRNETLENYYLINLVRKIQKNVLLYLSKQRKKLVGFNNENANFSFISSSNNYSSVKPSRSKKDLILATVTNFPLLKDEEKAESSLAQSYNPQITINNYYNMSSEINLKNMFVNNNLKSHDFSNDKKLHKYGSKFRVEGSQYRTQPNLNFNLEESK